ncbi:MULTISPECIES: cation:dicarboxylate symporter family transporter [unclassified Helicobacter]|uniref:cation:dicarboxylate symporter family transporter n=1 Tax=unclassified Helicobacter TaxID=2593540 RepID=UPI000CF19C1D|nr:MULTISPECIES: cation:dicarboxylase symporter family transporter [unclassified Helicobacter]
MQNSFLFNFFMLSQYQTALVLVCLCGFFYILKRLQDKEVDFSIRMLIGLLVGLAFGLTLQFLTNYFGDEGKQAIWFMEVKSWLGFFGQAFVNCIKMLVIPIIAISIIKVLLEIDKNLKVSILLLRSMFWIFLSVGIAAGVGVFLALCFDLKIPVALMNDSVQIREVKNIMQILLGLIPSNIVDSMMKNNIVALVFFCFIIGFSARSLAKSEAYKEAYNVFEKLIQALHQIIMNATLFIIRFMPYAVICMMAEVFLENGFDVIKGALSFIMAIYLAMIIMFVVHLLLVASQGLNPFSFAKKAFPVWIFAFSSRSSVGTLPLTIATLQNKMGVSGGIANFVASIGSTVGLNGCAGYFPAMVAVFIALSIGVPVDFSFIVSVILIAILGSLGIAGIPGSATMAASIMLTGIGFSDYFWLLSIVLAIDPIIDMARTASNVSGAMVASVCTDKGLKSLDLKTYNS